MFDGYLSFAGVEIVNAARVAAYVDALGIVGSVGDDCANCGTLVEALGGVPYTNPVTDLAPWYDPNIPESAQLAGFQIVSIDGTGSTGTREVSPLASGGGVVGVYRRQPRDLTVTFRAVAASQVAAAYSVSWLSKQLRGAECSPLNSAFAKLSGTGTKGCGTDVLCMLTACPTTPIVLTQYRVNLYDVGVTAGPSITKRETTDRGAGGCVLSLVEMEVTFTAGDPSWYYSAVRVADVELSSYYRGTTNYNIETSYADLGCGTEVCFDSIPAGCTPSSGVEMVPPPHACAGATEFVANHYAVPLDLSAVPSNMDLVPQLYYTGSPTTPATTGYEGPVAFQMRRPTPGSPCGSVPSPCDVPIELFTAQQRRNETGIIDWRRRKAYRTVSAIPVCPYPAFTRELAPFTWPTLICSGQMCLDVYINVNNDGRGQRIVLDLMRRVDGLS